MKRTKKYLVCIEIIFFKLGVSVKETTLYVQLYTVCHLSHRDARRKDKPLTSYVLFLSLM